MNLAAATCSRCAQQRMVRVPDGLCLPCYDAIRLSNAVLEVATYVRSLTETTWTVRPGVRGILHIIPERPIHDDGRTVL